ncbi:MAG TPA: MerR family transcriptional regulator [Gammaproteobacteria bacterium]|nr:MerR family transcriptional regulator [Gammaproteobacteria bacterium]
MTDILSGYIIEDETRLTLRQLCDACAVHAEYIIELIDEGFIEPSGMEKAHWCFNGMSIRRVQRAKRLQHDLGINLAGVALAVDLMDEIEMLRARLERM